MTAAPHARRYAPDMEKNNPPMTARGTRDELIDELHDSAKGWHHLANDKLRDQCIHAAEQLRTGADSAIAGHTRYEVT